jgi:hypothetical protein
MIRFANDRGVVTPGSTSVKDPKSFLADKNVEPWYRDTRQDLLATNVPISATGKYVIMDEQVPRAQVLVVKGIVPYAMARTNPGSGDESMQMIAPIDGNGWFSYEPQINDAAAYNIESNFNAPQDASVADDNSIRQRTRGLCIISDNPWRDANQQWANPLFTFVVAPTQRFRVIFSILPASPTNPLSSVYEIGVDATKRVDFAGVVAVGHLLSAQHYENLKRRIENGEP